MAAMLGARHYEIKAGRQVVAVGARKWAEERVRQGAHVARGVVRVAATKHFWTSLTSFIRRKFTEKIWHHRYARTLAKKASDVVRGKKEIKSKGPVSFYLKDVSDFKDHVL
jgi:hypothetical protein